MQIDGSQMCGSQERETCCRLMLSAAASHAKTYQTLDYGQELTEPAAVYGSTCTESLANYDPDTSSWRTSQLCLDGGWAEYSEPWPRSGMTRNGIAFQLPPSAPTTKGIGYGSLPTPAKRDGKDVSSGRAFLSQRKRHSPSLATKCLEAGATFRQLYNAYRIAMGYPSGWCDVLFRRSETP